MARVQRRIRPPTVGHTFCVECGALVPLVRGRWLTLHSRGSSDYTFRVGGYRRCPGSFMLRPGDGPTAT